MDFLNKAFAQLAELFRSMTPGARITSGLLLAVVVISLGYLFTSQSYGPGVYLMNGESFPPSLLHDMEAAFAKAGLPAAEIEGTRVRVPRGQQTAYMAALAEAGALPRDFGEIMEKALDSGSMWMSRDERRERLKIATQQELSQIISSMNGIDKAMIFWDTEEKPGLSRQRVTTASVNVRSKGLQELDAATVSAIRHTVAGAVAGLKSEDITVLDLNSGRSFRGDSSGMGNAADDPYAARKRMYEQDWKSEILTALSRVPGVTVGVNVELDPKRTHRQLEVKNDPKTVPLQTTDKTRSTVHEGAAPAGRPGYQANTPMALSPTASKGSHQEEEESEQTTVNALSSSTMEVENQGLIPQRVTVSIGVPTSYFEKIWQQRNVPDAGAQPAAAQAPAQAELDQIRQQEIANIRSAVAALLPPAAGVADPTELVTVTAFQDITAPELPEPAMSEKAITWLGQSWSTLGMILLALVSLVMLRSMIRSSPLPSQPAQASGSVTAAKEDKKEDEEDALAAARRLQRFQSGMSLKDELSMLVADDPDAAANILRTWIGHPG